MPTLTPRQNEIAAVVAVLESEDYDTPADMAKAVRFWSRVDKAGQCWVWTSYTNPAGYGRIRVDGIDRLAHRVSLSWATGVPLDTQLFALHRCDNPPCVRPSHLWWGTHAENMADAKRKGRNGTALGYRKPLCLKGHPLVEGNLYVRRTGERRCRICTLETNKRWVQRATYATGQ